MDGALAGQRAVVVGGGSGIGLACARVLARDGAAVTIVGRTEQKLVDAAAALADDGLTVTHCVCDALDGDSVRHAVDVASDDERRLDIAVVVTGRRRDHAGAAATTTTSSAPRSTRTSARCSCS